jgi:hypothetical protein
MKGSAMYKGMKFMHLANPGDEQLTEFEVQRIGPVFGANDTVSYYADVKNAAGETSVIVLQDGEDVDVTYVPAQEFPNES